jgi:molybdopterin converting factor subunit 1
MITARLFARLREQAGTGEERLTLSEITTVTVPTVADVYSALRARHPRLEADPARLRPAINEELADWADTVSAGDEVAFLPPVSGGSGASVLELTTEPLDQRRLEASVAHGGAGAICTFTGIVRDHTGEAAVTYLEYEAYAEMASRQMRRIAAEIEQRWPQARVAMAHRTGRLEVGEASVAIAVSCPHRGEAFAACRHGIDRLKQSVAIWKKESTRLGSVWVEGTEV